MDDLQPGARTLFTLGPVAIADSIVYTWLIMAAFWIGSWAVSRRLRQLPGPVQVVFEGIVGACENAVRELLPRDYLRVTPFVLSLWLYLAVANLLSLIPGFETPTRDLSVTSALAVLVYFSVHWFGIHSQGWRAYLKHYLSPNPILLPFHLLSEITRTVALAVRLFGNMMSMDMIALLLLLIAGLFVPVPILMLHIVEGLVQAYIFGTLALIYIASGIQSQLSEPEQENGSS
ncbi:F0F1 ATP synthase subunit A [Methylolobus aquaticus]